jgi:hypothetical protein
MDREIPERRRVGAGSVGGGCGRQQLLRAEAVIHGDYPLRCVQVRARWRIAGTDIGCVNLGGMRGHMRSSGVECNHMFLRGVRVFVVF